MSHKTNINANPRGAFLAPGGDDLEDGRSAETANQTPQAPIDVVSALDPPPQTGNPAIVSTSQGGRFTTGFVLPGDVSFEAADATFILDQSVGVTLGSRQICRTSGVQNNEASSICWLTDAESQVGIDSLFTGVFGTSAVGFEVSGICNDLFLTSNQVILVGNDSVGYNITGQSTSAIDMNSQTVSMFGDNTCLVHWEPSDQVTIGAIEVSTVSESGTGGEIYTVKNARLVVNSQVLDASSIATVENDGRFGLDAQVLSGNITIQSGGVAILKSIGLILGDIDVQAGGQLDIIALQHVGNITNNGIINGIINGVPFGTYQQKNREAQVLRAKDLTVQEPIGTDTPLQVKFGAAQFGSSDPVELAADGSVTFNQDDQYQVRILLEYGRTNAGSTAILIFRLMLNGTQFGDSQYAQIDSAQAVQPIEFSGPIDFVVDDVLTVEIIRDDVGFDDGGLFPFTANLAGVNDSPSATLIITRSRLVQPV